VQPSLRRQAWGPVISAGRLDGGSPPGSAVCTAGHERANARERQLAEQQHHGAPADSNEIRGRLGWEAERYASACARLEERGYIAAGPGSEQDRRP
jgi:hypothetical protein